MPNALRDPITPNVPDVIRDQASPVERHLLDSLSVIAQQKERIITCLEQIHAAQDSHDTRINGLEYTQKEHGQTIDTIRRTSRILVSIFVFIGPVVLILLQKLADRIFR